jgi:hypothetical protein
LVAGRSHDEGGALSIISKAINAFATVGVIATFAAAGLAIGGKAAQAETGGTVEQAGCWPEIFERRPTGRVETFIISRRPNPEAVTIQLLATKCGPEAVIIQVFWGELAREAAREATMEAARTAASRAYKEWRPLPPWEDDPNLWPSVKHDLEEKARQDHTREGDWLGTYRLKPIGELEVPRLDLKSQPRTLRHSEAPQDAQ